MKFRPFALCALLFAAAAVAALAAYTKQNARVVRVQLESTYNGGAQPTSVQTDAFLVIRLVNDSDSNDVVHDRDWKHVRFDLMDPALSATTITASGKTVTYPELAALIRKASLDRANAAGIQ